MARPKKPVVAFAYDFDGTLSPGNMQEHGFLPSLGIEPGPFWSAVSAASQLSDGDNILIYMRLMIEQARAAKQPVTRQSFKDHGRAIKMFPGVDGWFDIVNKKASDRGLCAEHYIISSGIKEMIEGTAIAKKFSKIFASSFLYDENGVATWPSLAINYTTKTQYLFRINKGTLDVWDHSKINKFVPQEKRHVPFDRMVFIGDGETDIPCMRLLTDQGGYAIAVYPPGKRGGKAKIDDLIKEKRARFIAPADYRAGSKIDKIVDSILDDIQARAAMQRLQAS